MTDNSGQWSVGGGQSKDSSKSYYFTPKPGAPAGRAQDEPLSEEPRPLIADLKEYLERERRRAIEKLRDLDDLLGRPQTLGPRRERKSQN